MSEREFNLLNEVNERLKRVELASSEILDAEEAAVFLRIEVSTLNKMTRPDNMLIPTAKIGGKKKVFMRKDLIAFVERNKQEALVA